MVFIISENNLIPLRESIVGFIMTNFFPNIWDKNNETELKRKINNLVIEFSTPVKLPDISMDKNLQLKDDLKGDPKLDLMKKYTKEVRTTSGRKISILNIDNLDWVASMFGKMNDKEE